MNQLSFVKEIEGISYYRFIPSFGKWYYTDYPEYNPPTFSHAVRMCLEYIQAGYEIIYMKSENKILGYIVSVNGGSRLRCSKSDDIVLGPIYIQAEHRGKGIGTRGIHAVLTQLGIPFHYCYEYIKPSNFASIKTVEKNGFEKIGYGNETGFTKRIHLNQNGGGGTYIIYRYKNK